MGECIPKKQRTQPSKEEEGEADQPKKDTKKGAKPFSYIKSYLTLYASTYRIGHSPNSQPTNEHTIYKPPF